MEDFKKIWECPCNAAENSDGFYDSPPNETSESYPYMFKLSYESMCTIEIVLSLSVRVQNDRNILKIQVDDETIRELCAAWSHSFDELNLKISLGVLSKGYHKINFNAKWDSNSQTVIDNKIFTKLGYNTITADRCLTISKLAVFADDI